MSPKKGQRPAQNPSMGGDSAFLEAGSKKVDGVVEEPIREIPLGTRKKSGADLKKRGPKK